MDPKYDQQPLDSQQEPQEEKPSKNPPTTCFIGSTR